MKEDEISGACGIHRIDQKFIYNFLLGKLKGNDYLGELAWMERK
jgi:hypothetical protein